MREKLDCLGSDELLELVDKLYNAGRPKAARYVESYIRERFDDCDDFIVDDESDDYRVYSDNPQSVRGRVF